jgi:hypothetical protein
MELTELRNLLPYLAAWWAGRRRHSCLLPLLLPGAPTGEQRREVDEVYGLAAARRAIPRRIHGVGLAITSTARSERRIAVRGPGVGVDASFASADPARAPWRVTAKSCQVPGTPRSSTLPRSSKPVPEPTIRSRTVRETRISLALAWPRIRAAMCTAIPPMSVSSSSHSPVWMRSYWEWRPSTPITATILSPPDGKPK